MGAIHRLFARWGFVKLDEYGLRLTPDGRIVSTRPAVLDDGLGARIVGWREADLAALELEPWSPPTGQPIAPPKRMPDPPRPKRRTQPPPLPLRPPAPRAGAPDSPEEAMEWELAMARARAAVEEVVAMPQPPPEPPPPAPQPLVDPADDEWDWQIAAARARAAAEWVEEAPRVRSSGKRGPDREPFDDADTIARPFKGSPAGWLARERVETAIAPPPVAVPRASQSGMAAQPAMMLRTVIPVPELPTASAGSVTRSLPAPRRAADPRASHRVASRR